MMGCGGGNKTYIDLHLFLLMFNANMFKVVRHVWVFLLNTLCAAQCETGKRVCATLQTQSLQM